jgi:predicted nuclease of predicted toxin-antitoxin system
VIRLLLDVHYSYRHIARVLAADGFDVKAAVNDTDLEELPDEDLFAVAIAEQRIMVTADTSDFNDILIRLADASIDHAGAILVPSSIRNDAYGVILRSLRHELSDTVQADWINRVIWLQRILE